LKIYTESNSPFEMEYNKNSIKNLKGEINMKTINFYKKTDKVFSVYAESLENVINNPLSYFQGYTNDMIITDITFQYPIYKDEKLREMTKEEKIRAGIDVQLEPGEIIKDRNLIKIPQPSKYHTWDNVRQEWDIDLKEVKRTFRHKFQNILLEKVYEDYNYNGKVFQMRPNDELNFLRVKSAIDIAGNSDDAGLIEQALKILNIEVTEEVKTGIKKAIKDKNLMAFIKSLPINWRLKDNSVAKVTFTDINNIYLMWILRGTAAQEKYTAITLKISTAKTVNELEAIKWE
jgi:putative uncharacterized protein FNV0174